MMWYAEKVSSDVKHETLGTRFLYSKDGLNWYKSIFIKEEQNQRNQIAKWDTQLKHVGASFAHNSDIVVCGTMSGIFYSDVQTLLDSGELKI